MGEARRRKKLLGSEYGKPDSKKSQAAKITKAQTLQGIKRTELSRPPIPDIEHLKLKLSSVELKDWVIDQWSRLNCFEIVVTPEDAWLIASKLLEKLKSRFQHDLNSDSTVNYNLSPLIELSVGINAYNWTVWASIVDRSTGFRYITSDRDEFTLA